MISREIIFIYLNGSSSYFKKKEKKKENDCSIKYHKNYQHSGGKIVLRALVIGLPCVHLIWLSIMALYGQMIEC